MTMEPQDRDRRLAAMLVEEVVAAMVNTRIYASTHPRVQGSVDAVRKHLQELAGMTGEDRVVIALAEDLLIYRQRPLLGASLSSARLIGVLSGWQAGGFSLARSIGTDDLREFLVHLARPVAGQDYRAVNQRFAQQRLEGVELLPPYHAGADTETQDPNAQLRVPVQFYQGVIDLLQNVTISVCVGGTIQFDPVKVQAEEMLRRLQADDGPLMNLARQDQYDAFTFGHSVRVAVLSMNFARSLTSDRDLLIRIGTAALLHDVGKSLIPFEILHSRTTLSECERRHMARHPELGAELLLDHHESDPLAIAAAFGHHLSMSGHGYPRTAHAHEMSLVTEVVRICDIYEALTAARPYKQPMTPTKAYRVMLSMEDRLNRRLLRRFIEVNGVFPTGQLVELGTGEVARVLRQGSSLTTPHVTLLLDRDRNLLAHEDQAVIDLGRLGDDRSRCICRVTSDAELVDADGMTLLQSRAWPAMSR